MTLEKELYRIIAAKVDELKKSEKEDLRVLSVRIPTGLYTLVRTKAALKEQTQQEAVVEALEHWLKEDNLMERLGKI